MSTEPGAGQELPVQGWLPQVEDGLSTVWRWFTNADFEKIFWTYHKTFPALSSNGIVIETENESEFNDLLIIPRIAVFDREGRLPVNLQRTGLQGDFPFEDDLLRSIGGDILAHALAEGPKNFDASWFFNGTYEGFTRDIHFTSIYSGSWPKWLIGRDGFVLGIPHLVAAFQPKLIVTVFGGTHRSWVEKFRRALPPDVLLALQFSGVFSDTNPRIKGVFHRTIQGRLFPDEIQFTDYQAYVPKVLIKKIKKLRPGRQVLDDIEQLVALDRDGVWNTAGGEAGPPWLEKLILSISVETDHPMMFSAVQVGGFEMYEPKNPIAERWMEIAGTPVIPFDVKERKSLETHVEGTIGDLLKIRRQAAVEKKNRNSKRESNEDTDDVEDAD